MLATSPEQDRHTKSDDRSKANPPGKCQYRQPTRLLVELRAENTGDAIGQSAQDRDDDEAGDHGNDVAGVVATPPFLLCRASHW